jgi:hypothetical protein
MIVKMYDEAVEREEFAGWVLRAIQKKEVYPAIRRGERDRNVSLELRQFGIVSWCLRRDTEEYHVVIDCGRYGSDITLEKVRNFTGTLRGIGNCLGIMITNTGSPRRSG